MFRHIAFITLALLSTQAAAAPDARIPITAGTGFYITPDGYVLTAHHVIQHCKGSISLHNSLMVLKASLVTSDEKSDLALLKIVPKLSIEHIAQLRHSSQPLVPGEVAIVAGYPLQTMDNNEEFAEFITANSNVIKDTGPQGEEDWMVFRHVATPGYSGGPVLDTSGNIIGVTSSSACLNQSCMADYAKTLDQMKTEQDQDKLAVLRDQANVLSDSNIAASLTSIKKFLWNAGVPYQERSSGTRPTAEELAAIAESLVNIRCRITQEDMQNDKGIRGVN